MFHLPYPLPIPWWLLLLSLPEPETLRKHGKNAYTLLKLGRNRAKRLGQEHRRTLERESWF